MGMLMSATFRHRRNSRAGTLADTEIGTLRALSHLEWTSREAVREIRFVCALLAWIRAHTRRCVRDARGCRRIIEAKFVQIKTDANVRRSEKYYYSAFRLGEILFSNRV